MRNYEFAGDHMKMVEGEDGTVSITFNAKPSGRVCGSCSLCCTLVPVPTIDKAAGQRCRHLRYGKRCVIYANRPTACRTWACRWLIDATTAGLSRPDRAHYVIDLTPDYIRVIDKETGVDHDKVPVIQIWCDPAYPLAHRDPALRAWLAGQAERWHCAALVRYDNRRAFVLAAPSLCKDRQWHEYDDDVTRQVAHTPEELEAVFGTPKPVFVSTPD
jgi:hypothetical protein